MLGFTPFKRHPNKFNYIPRYYDPEKEAREPVSYTHLTLPTSDLV